MRSLAITLLLAGCATTASAPPNAERYRALGTEPFWSVAIEGGRMTFEGPGRPTIAVRAPVPRPTFNGRRYETPRLTVDVTRAICSDGMSDRRYPDRVSVQVGDEALRGCGGLPLPPTSLADTSWTIVRIDGIEAARATMSFTGERLSGSSGCNRFSGGYRIDGEALMLAPVIATKMGCPGPAMAQENRLFAILEGRVAFRFRDGDTLVLTGAGGRTVTLKRAI